jgi:hypothetical protein
MRTLLLAERPFRDLRSRALLSDLPTLLAADEPLLIPSEAPRWPPGFAACPPGAAPGELGIARVVLAGCFTERAGFEALLARAGAAVAAGARLELRRIGLDGGVPRAEPPPGIAVLDAASVIELRDHFSADVLLLWGGAAPFRIAPYPERSGQADPLLAGGLPAGPILGLSILGGWRARRVWQANAALLRERLAPWQGRPVLPLPAEAPDAAFDELSAATDFVADILPGAPILLPELADPVWRRRQLTLPRLRGLVARCGLVAASQDLPAALAIAAGVPVLGLAMAPERRIAICLSSLANELPPGSDLMLLKG